MHWPSPSSGPTRPASAPQAGSDLGQSSGGGHCQGRSRGGGQPREGPIQNTVCRICGLPSTKQLAVAVGGRGARISTHAEGVHQPPPGALCMQPLTCMPNNPMTMLSETVFFFLWSWSKPPLLARKRAPAPVLGTASAVPLRTSASSSAMFCAQPRQPKPQARCSTAVTSNAETGGSHPKSFRRRLPPSRRQGPVCMLTPVASSWPRRCTFP